MVFSTLRTALDFATDVLYELARLAYTPFYNLDRYIYSRPY